VLLACPTLDLKQCGVLFSISVLASSQELQTNAGSPPRLSTWTEFPHRERGTLKNSANVHIYCPIDIADNAFGNAYCSALIVLEERTQEMFAILTVPVSAVFPVASARPAPSLPVPPSCQLCEALCFNQQKRCPSETEVALSLS